MKLKVISKNQRIFRNQVSDEDIPLLSGSCR
jgi:hypothetical protein